MENNEKKFIDGSGREITISNDDFKLVQQDTKLHDTKFNTKASTFFKDAMKRFAKSKSAVVGGCIVGILVILAIIVPFLHEDVGVYNVESNGGGKAEEASLAPKLFESGSGFWDGTVKKTGIVFDEETQLPVGEQYTEATVSHVETYIAYENSAHANGRGGYVNVYCKNTSQDGDFTCTVETTFSPSNDYRLDFVGSNEDYNNFVFKGYKIAIYNSELDKNYYLVGNETTYETSELTKSININEALSLSTMGGSVTGYLTIYAAPTGDADTVGHVLVESIKVTSSSAIEQSKFDQISFESGNDAFGKGDSEKMKWTSNCLGMVAYHIEFTYCNFRFDKYEYVYGRRQETIGAREVKTMIQQGSISIIMDTGKAYEPTTDLEELARRYSLPEGSGIAEIIEQTGTAEYKNGSWSGFKLIVNKWKYADYGYTEMPRFIFGTSSGSKDYCKLIFQGMRLSFLIAVGVSAVNIIIGLIWGSVSGYFGGWVDILMERICEILGGLPSTVLITLCILYGNEWNWGQYADILALMMALFLTGWMGVAGRTRTQFYRYKGREYVLASRTLGAKDRRLIFKHILPNAAGTIITSSILMIPSVIYTEASIAYLKLGLQNQVLLGVILADANNNYKGELAYTLYIPVVVMTLLLVSFNLFGNGLRDAFNPTLKGGK